MGKHVFSVEVQHNKVKYVKGSEVPADLLTLMQKKGLAHELVAPVVVANPPAPTAPVKADEPPKVKADEPPKVKEGK